MDRIAIIGGGLAGTACAYVFRRGGMEPVIFEASESLAAGASGNPLGLYNPRFFAEKMPQAEFYAEAFLDICSLLQEIGEEVDHSAHGSLHLITTPEKDIRFRKMLESWGWGDDLMTIVSAEQASDLAGIKLSHDAMFLPTSGVACPYKVCGYYARDCEVRLNESVTELVQTTSGWQVNGESFDAVILACGAGVLNFEQTNWFPVHTVRGQVLQFAETEGSKNLKTNLNYGGYLLPSTNGVHTSGSTFQSWLTHTDILEQDNTDILSNLEKAVPSLSGDKEVTYARASLRTASKDRLPIIGCVPDPEAFEEVPSQVQNMFVSTAHGSHGIVTSYKAAEIIFKKYVQDADNSAYVEVSPDRFLKGKGNRKTRVNFSQ